MAYENQEREPTHPKRTSKADYDIADSPLSLMTQQMGGYLPMTSSTLKELMRVYSKSVRSEIQQRLGFVPNSKALTKRQNDLIEEELKGIDMFGGTPDTADPGSMSLEALEMADKIAGLDKDQQIQAKKLTGLARRQYIDRVAQPVRNTQFLTGNERALVSEARTAALQKPVDFSNFVKGYLTAQVSNFANEQSKKIGELPPQRQMERKQWIASNVSELGEKIDTLMTRAEESKSLGEQDIATIRKINQVTGSNIEPDDLVVLTKLSFGKVDPETQEYTGPTLKNAQDMIVRAFTRSYTRLGEQYDESRNGPDVMQQSALGVLERLPMADAEKSPVSWMINQMVADLTTTKREEEGYQEAVSQNLGVNTMGEQAALPEPERAQEAGGIAYTKGQWYEQPLSYLKRDMPSEGIPVPYFSKTGRLFENKQPASLSRLSIQAQMYSPSREAMLTEAPWVPEYEKLRKTPLVDLREDQIAFLQAKKMPYKIFQEKLREPYRHNAVRAPEGKQVTILPEDVPLIEQHFQTSGDVADVLGFVGKNYSFDFRIGPGTDPSQDAALNSFDAASADRANPLSNSRNSAFAQLYELEAAMTAPPDPAERPLLDQMPLYTTHMDIPWGTGGRETSIDWVTKPVKLDRPADVFPEGGTILGGIGMSSVSNPTEEITKQGRLPETKSLTSGLDRMAYAMEAATNAGGVMSIPERPQPVRSQRRIASRIQVTPNDFTETPRTIVERPADPVVTPGIPAYMMVPDAWQPAEPRKQIAEVSDAGSKPMDLPPMTPEEVKNYWKKLRPDPEQRPSMQGQIYNKVMQKAMKDVNLSDYEEPEFHEQTSDLYEEAYWTPAKTRGYIENYNELHGVNARGEPASEEQLANLQKSMFDRMREAQAGGARATGPYPTIEAPQSVSYEPAVKDEFAWTPAIARTYIEDYNRKVGVVSPGEESRQYKTPASPEQMDALSEHIYWRMGSAEQKGKDVTGPLPVVVSNPQPVLDERGNPKKFAKSFAPFSDPVLSKRLGESKIVDRKILAKGEVIPGKPFKYDTGSRIAIPKPREVEPENLSAWSDAEDTAMDRLDEIEGRRYAFQNSFETSATDDYMQRGVEAMMAKGNIFEKTDFGETRSWRWTQMGIAAARGMPAWVNPKIAQREAEYKADALRLQAQPELNDLISMASQSKTTLAMKFPYREKGRKGLTASTTFEAVERGERTSTTRWNQRDIAEIKKLKQGDIFTQESATGRRLLARVTKPAYPISAQGILNKPGWAERWSQLEGWSPEHAKTLFQRGDAYGLQYEYVGTLPAPERKPFQRQQAAQLPAPPMPEEVISDYPENMPPEPDMPFFGMEEAPPAVQPGEEEPPFMRNVRGLRSMRVPARRNRDIPDPQNPTIDRVSYPNRVLRPAREPLQEIEVPGEQDYPDRDALNPAAYPVPDRLDNIAYSGAPEDLNPARQAVPQLGSGTGGVPPVPPTVPPVQGGTDEGPENFPGGTPEDNEAPARVDQVEHDARFQLPRAPKPEVARDILPRLRASQRTLLQAQTGYGKTSAIITGAAYGTPQGGEAGQASIILTPQQRLSVQMEKSLQDAGVRSIFMPGYPGEGAEPEKMAAYNAANQKLYNALGIEWERGMQITGKGALKPNGNGFEWQGEPLAMVMSPEKFVASQNSRLGQVFDLLGKNNLMGFMGFDEIHEMSNPTRGLMRDVQNVFNKNFPNASFLGTSGGLSNADISVLQNVWGVSQENTIQVPYKRDPNVRWSAVPATRDPAADVVNALEGTNGPTMVFPSYIGHQEQIVQALGPGAFRYHRNAENPLPPEEMAFAENKLLNGMEPGDYAVLSPAAATGIHRPEVQTVASRNPYDVQTTLQEGGRVRSPEENQPARDVAFALAPSTYEWRAKNIQKTGEALGNMGYMAQIYSQLRSQTYDRNWITASGQIEKTVGDTLERGNLNRFQASSALAYFQGTGAIELGLVEGQEGEEGYFGYQFTQQGSIPELASFFQGAQIKSARQYDQGTGDYKLMSLPERIREDTNYSVREQRALAGLSRQALGNTANRFEAGSMLQSGVESYLGGGLGGLEQRVNAGIPEDLAKKYAAAVTNATATLERQTASGGNVDEAQVKFAKTIEEARQTYLGGNPAAAAMGQEATANVAGAFAAAGNVNAANAFNFASQRANGFYNAKGAWVPGTQDISQGPPAEAPAEGMDSLLATKPGRFGIPRSGMMGVMYGLLAARRVLQYTVAPLAQEALYAGSQDYQAPAMLGDFTTRYGDTEAGFQMRQAAGKEYAGRGALQEFGAFMDLPYAMSGFGDGGARMGATSRLAAGLAGAGVETGIGLSMASYWMKNSAGEIGELGQTLGKVGGWTVAGSIGAGLGLVATGGLMEAHNALMPNDKRMTFDSVFRAAADSTLRVGYEGGVMPMIGDAVRSWVTGEPRKDEKGYQAWLKENLPQTALDWLNYKGEPEDVTKAREQADILNRNIGGSGAGDQYIPTYTAMAQLLGPGQEEQTTALLSRSRGLGETPQSLAQSFERAGQQLGLEPGSTGYADLAKEYQGYTTPGQKWKAEQERARTAGFASQFTSYMPYQQAVGLVQRYGINNQRDAGTIGSLFSTFQAYGGNLSQTTGQDLAGFQQVGGGIDPSRGYMAPVYEPRTAANDIIDFAKQQGPIKAGAIQSAFVNPLMDYGVKPSQMPGIQQFFAEQFRGFTPYQTELAGQIMGGDLGAASYASYNHPEVLSAMNMTTEQSRWFDPSGNRIYQSSGQDFLKLGVGQFNAGLASATPFASLARTGINVQSAGAFFGVNNPGLMSAYLSGGTNGAQQYASDQSYGASMASIGIGYAQIAAQQKYLWGGGDYTGTPSSDSLWGLQDRQEALSYKSQMRGFKFSLQKMDLSNEFSIQREDIQQERMDASVSYQRSMRGLDQAAQLQNRQWTREDWQYQDTVKGLQNQWGMEDINEAIRFSSGRDRQHLVKQRDRMATMQSLEEGQTDETRSRQEQVWAREDERFNKQTEYSEKLIAMDQKSFELNRSQREQMFAMDRDNLIKTREEYLKQHAIQQKIQELTRTYQAQQIEFQKQQLGAQAAQIKAQHDLEQVLHKNADYWDRMEGEISNINKYENAKAIFASFGMMMLESSNLDPVALAAASQFIKDLANLKVNQGTPRRDGDNIP